MANDNQGGARKLAAVELEAALESPLEDEAAWLERLVPMLGDPEAGAALFERLHAAAARDSRVAQLAEAYQAIESGQEFQSLAAAHRAEFFVHASTFACHVLRDRDRMLAYAEHALAVTDGAPALLVRLDGLFVEAGDGARLAALYGAAAALGADVERQVRLLEHAVRMLDAGPESAKFLLPLKDRLVRLRPTEHVGWLEDLQHEYETCSRHRALVDLLEAALVATPPLSEAEARPLHLRLARAYQQEVLDRTRAVAHLEALASQMALDAEAVRLAEPLLEQKALAPRVAALLSDAYAAVGRAGDEISSLTMELKLARPPRLGRVQRRLASLRQEYLDDAAGALELLEPLVTREPGDDEVRRRYLETSAVVGHDKEAARLLSRVIRNVTEDVARARIGLDIGGLYLRTGDEARARSTYEQVLETGADDGSVVDAARRLLEQRANLPPEATARALAAVASREPNPDARRAAALELLDLAHRTRVDRKIEIVGWRALLDSPREPEALARLEELYQAVGDDLGLSQVLERRAGFEREPARAREFAFRSADLRSRKGVDVERAMEAWRRYIAQYGVSRSVYAKMIPLLARSGAFAELATMLGEDAALATEIERASILARLAEVRLHHLDDVPGALEAARQSLQFDPSEARSRALLEELLERGENGAMDPLEPIYLSEYAASARISQALVRMLERRAERATGVEERAECWARLANVLDAGQLDTEISLAACGHALAHIARGPNDDLQDWIDRAERLAGGQTAVLAELLLSVLAQDGVEVATATALSVAAAQALEACGKLEQALEQYQRALEHGDFSVKLLEQADALASRAGHSASQRVARYEAALRRTVVASRRAEVLYAMGKLEHTELLDTDAAIATWQRVFEADARHWLAHEALLARFKEKRDVAKLERELRRGLKHFEGHQHRLTAARLAELLASRGHKDEALALCAPFANATGPEDDELLEVVERVATEIDDNEMLLHVLERRVAAATEPADRSRAFERLGDFFADWRADPKGAGRCWAEAAKQQELAGGARAEAARLYERVLSALPEDTETAARLVELYSEHGDWSRVPEAFAALQRGTHEPADCARILLSIEARAIRAGAANEFSDLVGAMLWGATQSASPWARSLVAAKARVYAGAGRFDEAADVCRTLLESSAGEPDEGDVRQFEALLESSPDAEWRRQNLRWLYEWRVDRSADAASLLLRWAEMEQRDFGDPQTALVLLDRAAAQDPQNVDVLESQIRLRLDSGDIEGGLDSLRKLRDVAGSEKSRGIVLRAATLLCTAEHGEGALTLIQGLLDIAPTDPEARQLAFDLLTQGPPIRERAAELLERVSSVADSTEDHRKMLESLLDTAVDHDSWEDNPSPKLKELRRRWFERLLRLAQGKGALVVAERAAAEFPQEESIWQVLEPLAIGMGEPQAVVRAYQRALGQPIGGEMAERLGRRLLTFAEERAIDPSGLTAALERVLALAPAARWALDRVKLSLSLEQRWPELFGLYDRAVQATENDAEKMDLLDEAAVAARDVVGDLDRAIGYWEQLFVLRPQDPRVDMVLERLYERRGHLDRLIAHLSHRVGSVAANAEQRSLRRRIAALWLDLGQPAPAFDLAEGLLSEDSEDHAVYELLERILVLPMPSEVGSGDAVQGAASLDCSESHRRTIRLSAQRLRQRYLAQGRSQDVGRALEAELAAGETKAQRAETLVELFEHRRSAVGDKTGAFKCLGELVLLEPQVAAHRDKLTELADELGADGELCDVLVAAAGHTDHAETAAVLLQRAAGLAADRLGDPERAAELYHRVLYGEGDSAAQLLAGRALERLQKTLGRSAERCDVLERLSVIEPDPPLAHDLLVEAARVAAEELNDPLRAARGLQRVLREAPGERGVLDTLIDVLRVGESWSELCEALASRVRLNRQGLEPREDLAEIARVFSEKLSDPDRAIEILAPRPAAIWGRRRDDGGARLVVGAPPALG